MEFRLVVRGRSVEDHVQVHHSQYLVTSSCNGVGIVGASMEALLFPAPEAVPDRVLELVLAHYPGGLDHGGGTASVVIRPRGVVLGVGGCAVQMSADYPVLVGVEGAGLGGDNVLAVVSHH